MAVEFGGHFGPFLAGDEHDALGQALDGGRRRVAIAFPARVDSSIVRT